MAEYQASTLPATAPTRRTIDDLFVPPPSVERATRRKSIGLTTGTFGALQDLQNRKLGKAGEEFILDAERASLSKRGRDDLAEQVVWTANDLGDGAGYDIASFRPDGTPVHIEVKTTNCGVRTPFHITRWEVEVSRREGRDLVALSGLRLPESIQGSTGWMARSKSPPSSSRASSSAFRAD